MQLRVWVNDTPVGWLREIDADRTQPGLEFVYDEGVGADQAVSLTMPVTVSPYTSDRLMPVFAMLLPEGQRRARAERLAKLTRTDDLGLLALVGANTVGRLRFTPDEQPPGERPRGVSTTELLYAEDSLALFESLYEQAGFRDGVAGVQPKQLSDSRDPAARTLFTSRHLLKAQSPEYPGLAVNEFFCLQAAGAAGMEVVAAQLSEDGKVLAVERFDRTDSGKALALEEAMVLMRQYHPDKYVGCMEDIAAMLEDYSSGARLSESLEQLFRQLVFLTASGNGDAHMKNFAVLYDDPAQVRLAPAYDLVCTQAYMPQDIPALALSFDYFAKRWWAREALETFGKDHCLLSGARIDEIFTQTTEAMDRTLVGLYRYCQGHPEFNAMGQAMAHSWCTRAHALDMELKQGIGWWQK